MASLHQARRSRRAARIIRRAFGSEHPASGPQVARYELLGSSVALAVVIDAHHGVRVEVARLLSNGRAIRLRRASRAGFTSPKEQISYFEMMYAKYGNAE